MRITLDLDFLSLFSSPISIWDAHKKKGCVYSHVHSLVKKYVELGILTVHSERPSTKNPHLICKLYVLTEKGKKVLSLFNGEGRRDS